MSARSRSAENSSKILRLIGRDGAGELFSLTQGTLHSDKQAARCKAAISRVEDLTFFRDVHPSLLNQTRNDNNVEVRQPRCREKGPSVQSDQQADGLYEISVLP
ncbi:hypothetical protein RRG08_052400 [Elysia crispata]|uniref:Uncharacterized protein n=1 Tax=Elysia crispata TaxID=231223 RepID=A0AAE1B241_9GAST|nr:hypothetical protein RRG08_052400 [Elysia crispata]